MPVIPFAQQEQITNPSNPVPIHSPEAAGMQGEAEASFGKAMFHLGNVLDAVNTGIEKENRKIDQMSGEAKMLMAVQEAKAEQAAAAPIEGDSDGRLAAKAYEDSFTKKRDAILKDISPDVQASVMAKGDMLMAQHAGDVLALETKKRLANAQTKAGNFISDLASQAANGGPDQPEDQQVWDNSLAKAEVFIKNSSLFSEAEKPEAIRNAKASIVREMVSGMATRGHWSEAIARLETSTTYNDDGTIKSRGLGDAFDAKEKESLIKGLRNDEATFFTKMKTEQEYRELLADKARKKDEADRSLYYGKALDLAGPSDVARDPILRQMRQEWDAKGFSEERFRSLTQPGSIAKAQDDKYSADILADVITGKRDAGDAIEKVRGDIANPNGGVSNMKGEQIIKSIDSIQNRFLHRGSALSQPFDDIEKATSEATYGLNGAAKVALQSKLVDARVAFHELLAKPGMTPELAAAQVARDKLQVAPVDLPAGSTPESIQKIRDEELARGMANYKNMSQEEQVKAIARDKALLLEKTILALEARHSRRTQAILPAAGGK